jgi:anti-sigma regulatory factor (Ser/Thr protein kinase)
MSHAPPNFSMPTGLGDYQCSLGQWQFSADAQVEGISRAHIAQALAEDASPCRVDDVVATVSELVANAVVHAQSDLNVLLERWQHMIVVAVEDLSPMPPVVQAVDYLAESGRGLQIVESVADHWGYDLTDVGKRVWAGFYLDCDCAEGQH